jgi:hypothetical protein
MDFESYSQFETAMHDLLRRRLHAQVRPYQARAQIGGVDQTVAQGPGTFTYAYAEADGWAAQAYEDLPKPTLFVGPRLLSLITRRDCRRRNRSSIAGRAVPPSPHHDPAHHAPSPI